MASAQTATALKSHSRLPNSLPPLTSRPFNVIKGGKIPTKASAKKTVTRLTTKEDRVAAILLRAIKQELGEADFFTREDLLQLSVLSHVSTISRYQTVCMGVHLLLIRNEIVAKSRTDLCLPAKAKRYSETSLAEQYIGTIRKLIARHPPGERVHVMDVVGEWTTDPHLTVNNKRVAVRNAIKRLVGEGLLQAGTDFDFLRTGG
jgi:hypothetical protein